MRFVSSRFVRSFLALASLALVARADVIVVRNQTGAPYTSIQAAVNVAVDGDVVLVKGSLGSYDGFSIGDKSISVVGDPVVGAPVRIAGTIQVHDVGATRSVVLANLELRALSGIYPAQHGLVVFHVDGELRVHRCTILGRQGTWMPEVPYVDGYGQGSPGGIGVSVEDCAGGVAFERCTIIGGHGGEVCGTGANLGGTGGIGLLASGARAALYDCTILGGGGGDGSYTGGPAGTAMVSRPHNGFASQLMASNTRFEGGLGGFAEDLGNYYIGPGGDGGGGLVIESGAFAWQLDCTYVGGVGGRADGVWPDGDPGVGFVNNGSTSTFQVSSVALDAPAIVRAGSTMTFTFRGDPGDELYLFDARRTSFAGIPSWRGFLLARPQGMHLQQVVPTPLVTIPASGTTTVTLDAPDVWPATNGRTVHYQAYRKTTTGSVTLGGFATVTVVGATY